MSARTLPRGGPFDGFTVDANALGWAYACASSRAFRVAGPDRPAAMLPLVDVANHSFAPSAEVRPSLGLGPGAIEMVAARRVKAGEEITLNYGNLTNDAFLLDYGFVPSSSSSDGGGGGGGNPHDTAGLRWDIGLLEAAREVAGLSAVPFGAAATADTVTAGAGAAAGGSSGCASTSSSVYAPWQERALRELRLEGGGQGGGRSHGRPVAGGGGPGGGARGVVNSEVLVTRDSRQPVDLRLLAGLRVLYASSPRDLVEGRRGEGEGDAREGGGETGGGGGKGKGNDVGAAALDDKAAERSTDAAVILAPITLGALWDSPLDRVREAYALRTCQAALALALGNFPTTVKEDEVILGKLEEEAAAAAAAAGGGGEAAAAARQDLEAAVRFRMGKKGIISGAMKSVDERLRAVLSSEGV